MISWVKSAFYAAVPRRVLVRCGGDSRKVFLTFDDGPDPENTGKVLDVLKREGAQATFFMLGERIRKHPDLARRVVREGHGAASHSWTHGKFAHWDFAGVGREIALAESALRETCGTAGRDYRPPYGRITAPLLIYALAGRVRIVLWSLDSDDDRDCSPRGIVEKCARARAGDILLFHDDNEAVVEALPEMLAGLRARGLEFGLIGEIGG